MKNLAIIPARSGSKGVKDKNVRLLGGTPLFGHTIEAAIQSDCFDEVMVSTDTNEYAEIAIQLGAQVPFLRSKELSSDEASSWDVVKEVLQKYCERGLEFDTVCLLQPTSPFRSATDIQEAYKMYNECATVAVVSVCEMEHSPRWCGTLPSDYSMDGFIERNAKGRRQEEGKHFRLNGAIYIVSTAELLADSFLYRKGTYAYVMPLERSVDIDTEDDFCYAEYIINKKVIKHV